MLQVHVFFVCLYLFFTSRLKKFFFDAGNMAYVKALVHVPVLPQVWSSILEWYYDQEITSFFPSDFKRVFVLHLTGNILRFEFYAKAVFF